MTVQAGEVADQDQGFWSRAGQLAMVLGPTTVLTAALYYVGHVSTRAFYAHFGVHLSALDISTSAVLLRSVDQLFDPLSVIVLAALGAFGLHHLFTSSIQHRPATTARLLAVVMAVTSLALAVVGVVGLAGYLHSTLTPWALGFSGFALEYAAWLGALALPANTVVGGLVRAGVNLRRGLVAALVLVALLWGATVEANAGGQARAVAFERALPLQSQAVVYSRTDLRLSGPGISLTRLTGTPEDFRYRYNGLRPLLHSNDTWLLLPVGWTSGNGSTVIMLPDAPDRVRVDLAP